MAPKVNSGGKTTPAEVSPPVVCSVLVVDDDREMAQVLETLIEGQGYRALQANNGREALAILEEHRPALMLIDLFMPHMSGAELLKIIRRNPALASIPRVLMTAANDQMIGVREDIPVLYKPVDFDALTGLLRKYCEPPRAQS